MLYLCITFCYISTKTKEYIVSSHGCLECKKVIANASRKN